MELILEKLRDMIHEEGVYTFSEEFHLFNSSELVNTDPNISSKYNRLFENIRNYAKTNDYISIVFLNKLKKTLLELKTIDRNLDLEKHLLEIDSVLSVSDIKKNIGN